MNIGDLSFFELEQYVLKIGENAFRARQIFKWVHGGAQSCDEMTDLSKKVRARIQEDFDVFLPQICKKQISRTDNTVKYLMRMKDNSTVETVVMDYKHGKSICVSSQVGCRMGCSFCASTLGGLVRNLSPFEIEGQVLRAARDLGVRISNIVIMGIGEPLDNYDNVIRFLHNINNERGANIGMRHITLSTCGLADKIRTLAVDAPSINLAVSLHAPTDEARRAIMPVAKRFTIDEIMRACDFFYDKTHRRITFEYALVKGKNASEKDAAALARLLSGKNCHVNVIPVNPVAERGNVRTSAYETNKFMQALKNMKINATLRRELGPDIDASCGQLRNKTENPPAMTNALHGGEG